MVSDSVPKLTSVYRPVVTRVSGDCDYVAWEKLENHHAEAYIFMVYFQLEQSISSSLSGK